MFVFAAFCAVLAALPSPAAGRALPDTWFRPRDEHPVHRLFSRQTTTPEVGSPEWTAKYPAGKLKVEDIPQAWMDALNAAQSAGRIPDIPISSTSGSYVDANGTTLSPGREPVCSSAAQCKGDDQIYDVPDGTVALSFDDGPLPASRELYKFLREHNQKVTHFFIGSYILGSPDIFLEAFNTNGDDIAVHTWSHPHMTQLSNELVLAELGWTMQIIHDSTGGRLPRYWRPSYGDSDNRVRAIAREIFGLQTVIWNNDTNDWNIGKGQTIAKATAVLTKAYKGPKSPGLNILEHELTKDSVKVFTDTYPLIAQNGWTAKSIPDAMGATWYLNAADNTSPVTDRVVSGGPNATVPSAGSSTAAAATSDASATPTSAGQNGGSSSNGAVSVRTGVWTMVGALVFGTLTL